MNGFSFDFQTLIFFILSQFWIIDEFDNYSQTPTNGHLSTMTNFFTKHTVHVHINSF